MFRFQEACVWGRGCACLSVRPPARSGPGVPASISGSLRLGEGVCLSICAPARVAARAALPIDTVCGQAVKGVPFAVGLDSVAVNSEPWPGRPIHRASPRRQPLAAVLPGRESSPGRGRGQVGRRPRPAVVSRVGFAWPLPEPGAGRGRSLSSRALFPGGESPRKIRLAREARPEGTRRAGRGRVAAPGPC